MMITGMPAIEIATIKLSRLSFYPANELIQDVVASSKNIKCDLTFTILERCGCENELIIEF